MTAIENLLARFYNLPYLHAEHRVKSTLAIPISTPLPVRRLQAPQDRTATQYSIAKRCLLYLPSLSSRLL